MKKRITLIIAIFLLVVAITPAYGAIPTTSIVAVVKDESVTVQTSNFPANHTFHVFMGYNGTQGINGYLISKLTTGEGGSFKAKFYIPDELAGEDIVAVRFESVTESKYYNYNWFYNQTATGSSDTTCSNCTYNNLPYGFPQFDILSVVKGTSVKVQTHYFPTEQRFAVMMKDGAMSVIDWIEVAGFETHETSSQIATFAIPSELQFKEKIAIKFYNINDGFITYDLFDNINQ